MRILVTGGAGFLGSNLIDRLLREDNEVICLDNLYTGRMSNIEPYMKNKAFRFVCHDIVTPYSIDGHLEQIYNLACPASPPHYQKSPTTTTKTSVIGTINMLDLATEKGARLLQFSTSEIYGDPLEHPQSEDYRGHVNPVGIRACYDEGKRCAETLCFDYHREFRTNIKVVRIFNTYGPNMDPNDGRVVSNFIMQALRGHPLTVYGDGSQTRSFCYVDDLLDGIWHMMNTSSKDFLGPVNLGNPIEFTVRELAEQILKITGSSSQIIYEALPQDDPTQRKPDISLAKHELGWEPKITIEQGVNLSLSYFEKLI